MSERQVSEAADTQDLVVLHAEVSQAAALLQSPDFADGVIWASEEPGQGNNRRDHISHFKRF